MVSELLMIDKICCMRGVGLQQSLYATSAVRIPMVNHRTERFFVLSCTVSLVNFHHKFLFLGTKLQLFIKKMSVDNELRQTA